MNLRLSNFGNLEIYANEKPYDFAKKKKYINRTYVNKQNCRLVGSENLQAVFQIHFQQVTVWCGL